MAVREPWAGLEGHLGVNVADILDSPGKNHDARCTGSLRRCTCNGHFGGAQDSLNRGCEFSDVLVPLDCHGLPVDGCIHSRLSKPVAHKVEDGHHISNAGIQIVSLLHLRSQNELVSLT